MTEAFAKGEVPSVALKRYLIQDHMFLDAFASLLAAMISRAPTLVDRIPGAQFLAVITGPENTYFERSFDHLGITAAERQETPPAVVTSRFIRLMRDAAARANFADMLAVLVVAEWSYLEWGERVAPIEGLPFHFLEWVDLHRGPGFRSLVGYLRALLDAQEPHLSAAALASVRGHFARATELELGFWNMAWTGEDMGAEGAPASAEAEAVAAPVATSAGAKLLARLRAEPFNLQTEKTLQAHPMIKMARRGKLRAAQRRAFLGEQYAIQLSDAASFALLAGHAAPFTPSSLLNVTAPPADAATPSSVDGSCSAGRELFQLLLGGEVYAAPLLLAQATSAGDFADEAALRKYVSSGLLSSRAQAYPSFWARLALRGDRAIGAAAVAVNFPAWGRACGLLRDAMVARGASDAAVGFLAFFAAPIPNLDEMAAAVLDAEWAELPEPQAEARYAEVATAVRLLQEYELGFWDAVHAAK